MRFPDLLMMSVNNLRRRKLRTFLTVLGVIIGTASIVVMVSLGIGLNEMTMEQIASWGSLTTIEVYANDNGSSVRIIGGSSLSSSSSKSGDSSYITDEVIADFQKIPYVTGVSLRRRTHPGFWRNGNGFWKWCTPAFYQCENR